MDRSIAPCARRRAVSEPRRPTQFGRSQAPDETSGASADEKRALFNGTARRVYRLD